MKTRKTFSTKDISEILGVSIRTVQRLIEKKKLRAFKIGRGNRIFQEDFEKYLSTISNIKEEGIVFEYGYWEEDTGDKQNE